MADLKLRITKCYLVEVVDKEGNVQEYRQDGDLFEASDFCFGTRADAELTGKQLIKFVKNSEVEDV